VGPAPASERVVRAGARVASRQRAAWFAAYVDAPGRAPWSEADRSRLESHLRLAESLGATVVRLSGVRASDAILAYAHAHGVGRIVLGKPTHTRLRDALQGSLLDEIVRGSGDIDVHVLSGDEDPGEGSRTIPATRRRVGGGRWLAAVAFAGHAAGLPDVEMLYLLAVMVVAARLGRGPAVLAAATSVLAFDLAFVPPRWTLEVSDGRYVLSFAMMFGVGLGVSALTARIREQERDALRREARTSALLALSRDLAAAVDAEDVARAASRHAAGLPTGEAATAADRELRDVFERQIAAAQARVQLAAEARDAQLRVRSEELRSALLASVSHDLRTPLAVITGAATTLRDRPIDSPELRRELLDTVCDEAERLDRLVGNLLETTRLASGPVALRRAWVPLEELVGSALERLRHALATVTVNIDLPPDLPLVEVDPVLAETILVNLVENATKHARTAIDIAARPVADAIELDVADRGPGLAPGSEELVFDRFYRAPDRQARGVGLGLAIARAIALAHGGDLTAHARPGGGAVFRLHLPLGEPPSLDLPAPVEGEAS
jgi:K+-sensing histidine kinase KdpD